MQIKFLTKQISSAIAATCLVAAASHTAVAAPLDFEFEAMKEKLPNPLAASRAHFVRLEMAPLSVWESEQFALGFEPSSEQKAAMRALLSEKLAEQMDAFAAAGYAPSNPVLVSDVGFTVVATDEQMRAMKGTQGVAKIIAKQVFTPNRDYSTPWVGADIAHSYGLKGKDQVVAIIDTGVDYVHKDFGGEGDYTGNDPSVIEEGTFPTERVVSGWDFAGFDYSAGDPEFNIPQPDADPMDDGSHGSHVAGIAAGNGIDGILGAGIAPEASIMALKVFGASGSTSLTADAIEMAMDPNGDGDISDAVDVINMSLGSPFGDPEDPTSVAAQNASESGIVVVASAGNSGNGIPYVSGSPGSAPGVITVASTISGGVPSFFLPFNSASGESFEFFAQYAAISPDLESDIVGDMAVADPYDACTPLVSTLSEKIALITRGACAFTTKLQNAMDAGATAAVVVNNVPGAPIVMGGTDVGLAGAMISLDDGSLVLAELSADYEVVTELAESNEKADPSDDDTMSGFSSRGPGPTGVFKPDLAAPGSLITSALAGSGEGTLTISGTSMSAPQVAGMAALMKEKFHGLNSAEIKAIMQNTTVPAYDPESATGTPALSLQGTGIIDVENALNATGYAMPGGIGFGLLNPEYNASVTKYITVTNIAEYGKRISITHEPNQTLPEGAASFSMNSEIYVGPGQTQTFPVTLNLQASAMETGDGFTELDGWFVLEGEGEVMRVGYQAIVEPASRLNYSSQGNVVNVRNDAFGDATVFAYTLAGGVAGETTVGEFGFRETSPISAAFGLNASVGWTNFSRKRLSILIDTDEDGEADYQAEIADLQLFQGQSDPTGTLVSGIIDLNDPEGSIQLLYLANADFNNSVLQFQLDTYGDFGFLEEGDTTFSYEMTLTDRYNGQVDGEQSGVVDLADNVLFDIPASFVEGQQNTAIEVFGSAATLWLSPSESSAERRAVIR